MNKTTMRAIYDRVKTPYKYGPVVKLDNHYTDSPIVFKHEGKYYMTFVMIDRACKEGYTTRIAESDDLIHWHVLHSMLSGHHEWDKSQSGGYMQFQDISFGGSNALETVAGRYWMAYIGGNLAGYETDPLSMGVAEAAAPLGPFEKHPAPIFTGQDADARRGETLTIYKADMFRDPHKVTGHPYVCAYNAKDNTHRESIYLAVSDDGIHWSRYLDEAIIPAYRCADSVKINGDPQIVLIDGHYVMFYFILDGPKAYNTFAVSDDLQHWTKWDGEPLITAEYPWENIFAHKQWIIEENDIVYHYYCAFNSQNERFIALATSKPIKE